MRAIIMLRLEMGPDKVFKGEAKLVMDNKKSSKFGRLRAVFANFLLFMSIFIGVNATFVEAPNVSAVLNPDGTSVEESNDDSNEDNSNEDNNSSNDASENENDDSENGNGNSSGTARDNNSKNDTCKDSLGALGWLVCPTTGKIAEAVDWLYDKIEDILVIQPISSEDGTPIYEIWKYCLGVANVVFVIFLLIVIYSQLTGVGISNYGIKKALPKLIITAILVNLSFLICMIAVDVSNIVGSSLRGLFTSIEAATITSGTTPTDTISFKGAYTALAGGGSLALLGGMYAFEVGAIWMLIPVVLGAIVAVATGLITIALRQALVVLLVMVAPLAIVAYMLPNTEKWFTKWKDMLIKMLVFYPVFSLLFGASSLAGFAIMMSASSGFGVLLGMAVQVFPLFFAWKLMQMSGTVLGNINSRLRGATTRPLAASRDLANARRRQTAAHTLLYWRTPSAHLRRFVDNRNALTAKYTGMLEESRKNEANLYVQRKISGDYDGTKAQGNQEYLKPNKYTRLAKDLSNSSMASETATLDTAHVLGNYGDYFVAKDVRKRIKAAEKAKDSVALRHIEATNPEQRRAATGAKNYLELSRAQMTAENDNEADFNYMVGQFLDASMNYNPKDTDSAAGKQAMEKYRHYIVSSAGGLGETGQTRVLGKIIAKAASVESNQRRDINIIANKFPPDKRNFRNFLFNYYVDDDGYATDKNGNVLQEEKDFGRDYLRVNDPKKLVMWDQVDEENGPYFDWYDSNGAYVTRIYKRDKSAIKELMSNFDAPINDPINNLLAIHAGIKEDPNSNIEVLKHMGLDSFRTTVGRALLSAPFKEKNAAFSPMVAEMVKKGYIKNYAQEYIAYLDSYNKATKPGAFNVQDADAISMFIAMMDPDKWENIFPTELIRGYRNVNGKQITGTKYDENGNEVKVPAEEATREELMKTIEKKYIIPAAYKIVTMMSRQTQNTIDNQKPGTVEKWKALKEVFDEKWGEGKAMPVNPYKQNGDMRKITKDIRDSLSAANVDGDEQVFNVAGRGRGGGRASRSGAGEGGHTVGWRRSDNSETHVNHAAEIFNIYNGSLDADDFAIAVDEYCARHEEIAWIAEQLQDYIVSEGYGVSKEQLYEKVEELLAYVDYDD